MQYSLEVKTINIIALGIDEFFHVSQCNVTKEMYDTLQVTHKCTDKVKKG